MTGYKLFALGLGLAVGNYIYQFFSKQNYDVALERSVFQWMTLITVWLMS